MFKIASQMKSKFTIFIAFFDLEFSHVTAQNQDHSRYLFLANMLKSKNYDSAYSPLG